MPSRTNHKISTSTKAIRIKLPLFDFNNVLIRTYSSLHLDALKAVPWRANPIWHMFQREWEIYRIGKWS